MQYLGQIAVGIRIQAGTLLVFAAMWQWIMWSGRKTGENTAIILQFLFYILPLLTTALSVSVLGEIFRRHKRPGLWVYLAIVAGFSPWVALGVWYRSAL